jgi:hypothetical protein
MQVTIILSIKRWQKINKITPSEFQKTLAIILPVEGYVLNFLGGDLCGAILNWISLILESQVTIYVTNAFPSKFNPAQMVIKHRNMCLLLKRLHLWNPLCMHFLEQ